MFMEIGSVPVENQMIPGQGGLQVFLILIAFASVPVLLFPKPYILKARHEAMQHHQLHDDDDHGAGGGGGGGHGGHGEFDFGEEMVHQMIHTIEYVLGTRPPPSVGTCGYLWGRAGAQCAGAGVGMEEL